MILDKMPVDVAMCMLVGVTGTDSFCIWRPGPGCGCGVDRCTQLFCLDLHLCGSCPWGASGLGWHHSSLDWHHSGLSWCQRSLAHMGREIWVSVPSWVCGLGLGSLVH